MQPYLVALLPAIRKALGLSRKFRSRQKWLQTLHPKTLESVQRSGSLKVQCW